MVDQGPESFQSHVPRALQEARRYDILPHHFSGNQQCRGGKVIVATYQLTVDEIQATCPGTCGQLMAFDGLAKKWIPSSSPVFSQN